MHIFYCDDDLDDIEFFSHTVGKINSNITISAFTNPKDALASLQVMSHKPDFIFFDDNMPKLGGLDFAMAIKKNKGLQNIPVIILSGSLHDKQIAAYQKAGVHSFFVKTNLAKLEEALRSIIR